MQPSGKLIYLASPYSHSDPAVQKARFIEAVKYIGWAMNTIKDGFFYSPVVNGHPVSIQCGLPGDWEYWKEFDECIISRCDELWVLVIDGFDTSKGIKGEVSIAKHNGLPIRYITPHEGTFHEIKGVSIHA